jgi:hypothetical protein
VLRPVVSVGWLPKFRGSSRRSGIRAAARRRPRSSPRT